MKLLGNYFKLVIIVNNVQLDYFVKITSFRTTHGANVLGSISLVSRKINNCKPEQPHFLSVILSVML